MQFVLSKNNAPSCSGRGITPSMVQRCVVEGDGVSIADPDIEIDWELKGLQGSMLMLIGLLILWMEIRVPGSSIRVYLYRAEGYE